LAAILAYPWPGNVPELANAVERAVIMAPGKEIEVEDLAVDIQTMAPESTGDLARVRTTELKPGWLERPWRDVRREVLEEAEVLYLRGLLEATQGRIAETAAHASMDPRSLHEKMRKYGLRKEDFRK
jgi:DNA-binding NtrC family response regulator